MKKIAEHYNLEFHETLTGFKWLAKIPGLTFGYEEALGYCVDSASVNDKDGISAGLMLAQLATELARENKTLLDLLNEIWQRHGFHGTEQISVRVSDLSRIPSLLASLRKNPPQHIAGRSVKSIDDLMAPKDGLPPTDGIRLWLDGDIRIIIRPSGTEAKIKCYIEVVTHGANSREESSRIIGGLKPELLAILSV